MIFFKAFFFIPENFIALKLESEEIDTNQRKTIYSAKDMSLVAEPSTGAIIKAPSRQTILQPQNMDETIPSSQDFSLPTQQTKKVPSLFRKTILQQQQKMDVTLKTNQTVNQPQDMIESDDDIFEDALEDNLTEKVNYKSRYIADMELCSPTQHEEKSKSSKNRRTVHTPEEMIMSPAKSFEQSDVSQDTSANIYLLENLANDSKFVSLIYCFF